MSVEDEDWVSLDVALRMARYSIQAYTQTLNLTLTPIITLTRLLDKGLHWAPNRHG